MHLIPHSIHVVSMGVGTMTPTTTVPMQPPRPATTVGRWGTSLGSALSLALNHPDRQRAPGYSRWHPSSQQPMGKGKGKGGKGVKGGKGGRYPYHTEHMAHEN